MTSAVQKASQALNERGERLGRAEEKTEELRNTAQQFAETAHKVRHLFFNGAGFVASQNRPSFHCRRNKFRGSLS